MAIDLREIRTAAGVAQKDAAVAMGYKVDTGRISLAQFESRGDWMLSSLRKYFDALGVDSAELVVTVDGHELRFDL